MIRITRGKSYADYMRAYHVLIDGEDKGQIRPGETREFPITGHHTLQMKVDWCTSRPREFDAGEQPVEFRCGTSLRGIKFFFAIFYVLFKRNDYIRLEQTSTT